VAESRTSAFGILECSPDHRGRQRIARFIEKPKQGETPSNLASIGRYLVTPELLETLSTTGIGKSNELWFSDAVVTTLQQNRPVYAFVLTTGRWFTVGDPIGFSDAVAAARENNWMLTKS
jgi:UTP--glucose-1-phosphate uridylyltransferase